MRGEENAGNSIQGWNNDPVKVFVSSIQTGPSKQTACLKPKTAKKRGPILNHMAGSDSSVPTVHKSSSLLTCRNPAEDFEQFGDPSIRQLFS